MHCVATVYIIELLQARGCRRFVQGSDSLHGARDAQHLPCVPHLRVHGQQVEREGVEGLERMAVILKKVKKMEIWPIISLFFVNL